MKVLFVTPSYYPIVGGSEVLTGTLSTRLKEKGISADIMTFNMTKKWMPRLREETVKEGMKTIFKEPAINPLPNLPNPLFNLLRLNVIPCSNFTKKFKKYDVIHFVGEADLTFPLFSHFVKKPRLLQCVGIFRRGGIFKYYMFDRAFLGKLFNKVFPSLADRFVISSKEEMMLLREMGVPKRKIAILQIGVDLKTFRSDETKKKRNLVLFIGRIDKIKGLHILLDALSSVKTPLELAIIGPRWDQAYSKEMESMANMINEDGVHNITFIGELSQTDLIPWYQRASLLVCPYLYETYSNVIRESLACGTPVISTGTHLCEDSADGVILTEKNPTKLAEAIERLLEDEEMLKKCGVEGRKFAEQHFSWDSIIKNLTQIYESVILEYHSAMQTSSKTKGPSSV
jgi:glycosyltransferase involved in cell wall biosynthesis